MKKSTLIEYSFTCKDKNVNCNEAPKISIENSILVLHSKLEAPVFTSLNGVKAITQDLNNIFKDKYKINYDAFGYKEAIVKIRKERIVEQPWYKLGDTKETYFEKVKGYAITTNKKFDWKDADGDAPIKYASIIYDVINMEHQIYTGYGDKKQLGGWYKYRDGEGGGMTINNSKVIVSDKNKSYGERGTKGTRKVPLIDGKRIGFNKGGVALHEWLHHVMGLISPSANDMRIYYNMRTGGDHGNIIIPYYIPEEEQKRLDEEKKKTGDGK